MPISLNTAWLVRGPEDRVSQEEQAAYDAFVARIEQQGRERLSGSQPSGSDEPKGTDNVLFDREKPGR